MNKLKEMRRLWGYCREVYAKVSQYGTRTQHLEAFGRHKLRIYVATCLGFYIENILIPHLSPSIT